MKRLLVSAVLAASFICAPLAHANSAYVPIGDPYTDTIGLWSDLASALSFLANNFAILFNGHEFAASRLATPSAALAAAAANAEPAQLPTQETITYTVQAGDTLSGIAQTFAVPISNILAANDLSQGAILHPGETLIIPDPQTTPATSSELASNTTSDQTTLSQNVKSAALAPAQSSSPNSTNVVEADPALNASAFVTQSELAQVLLALSISPSTKSTPTTVRPSPSQTATRSFHTRPKTTSRTSPTSRSQMRTCLLPKSLRSPTSLWRVALSPGHSTFHSSTHQAQITG